MSTNWSQVRYGPWPDTPAPRKAPDEAERVACSLPATLRPIDFDGVDQPMVFDPASLHYANAMRLGEPRFGDAERGERWRVARRYALDAALAAVADSPWAEHLVLRGSVLMTAWFGDEAREPGDLDFVVVPRSWNLDDPRTDRMLTGLARAAEELSADGPARLEAAGAVSDEIWTYDRVPGRRLVLPWRQADPDEPGGTVQLDFVFGERLPLEPERTRVPRPGGGPPLTLTSAGPELSLAWKVQWLLTDSYPEGKDLYDAVLLAEAVPLRYELLCEVLHGMGDEWRRPPLPELLSDLAHATEWDEFRKDAPNLPDTADAHAERLRTALAPTFSADRHRMRVTWFSHHDLPRYRGVLAREGMAAVQRALTAAQLGVADAVAVTSELLGGDSFLTDAVRVVADFRALDVDKATAQADLPPVPPSG
ncbi:nucleotidyl transferase AbiEii/AbiGii toxin family protein [Streptomyces sp. OF3]|uniref:Nucleotidyl transferase AbiEii/AbiGii toxin family protein n=1 Tax=Streptomyces alkaliterrae TaxID=2213162 RepID=A0A7W3WGN5_9ACTN|nr:nucleotidyl transferase AbiEii/AbiGii toxin family protein [Streptomyces alkaliterrae]MBB1252033.1 nucleotidyl transferase AbiEii/AbiGii toxin family protein [Streptomyces alkaliterrae]